MTRTDPWPVDRTHAAPSIPPPAPKSACGCPDDCNCRRPWRFNYCGCKAHA